MSDRTQNSQIVLGLILIGLAILVLIGAEPWPHMLFVIAAAVTVPMFIGGGWRKNFLAPLILIALAFGVAFGPHIGIDLAQLYWALITLGVGLWFTLRGAMGSKAPKA